MQRHNCIVQETEEVRYIASSYMGPESIFDNLKEARAAYREIKNVYGCGSLLKASVKTITIESSEWIAR